MGQASARTFEEVVKPYVVAVVTVSTTALMLGMLLGRGQVVLVALVILLASAVLAPGTASEAFSDSLPALGKTAIMTVPAAVVLVGAFLLSGGMLIDKGWMMIAGASLVAAGFLLGGYCLDKVGPGDLYNALFYLLMFRFPGPIHPSRRLVRWGNRWIKSKYSDERHYAISGLTGTGKSWLVKLFIMEALREVGRNPYAKMVIYEPKAEFYAWLKSMDLRVPLAYFLACDARCVPLDYGRDYPALEDSRTLSLSFYPRDPNEKLRFWGDCLRDIFAAVWVVITDKLGHCDLRIALAVLEDEEDTSALLGTDPYLKSARYLVGVNRKEDVDETTANIRKTIASRVSEMKSLSSQLDYARQERDPFSLRDFVRGKRSGVLVIARDNLNPAAQDAMNSMLFTRLVQLLDREPADPRRKVFIVIDEFPILAGNNACESIVDLFLRLRAKGVTALITYQLFESIERVYGAKQAREIVKMCQNAITDLEPATEWSGLRGMARAAVGRWWWPFVYGRGSYPFKYPPSLVRRDIPKTDPNIEPFLPRDSSQQRMRGLTKAERVGLGLPLFNPETGEHL